MRRKLRSIIFLFALLVLSAAQSLATTITISATQPQFTWPYGGTTATLRIWAVQSFLASDGTFVLGGNVGTSSSIFKSISCTVSGGQLSCPSFTLPSTTDSQDLPSAVYTAIFFDQNGTRRDTFMSNFRLPASNATTTWAQIRLYNIAPPLPQPRSFYTTDQVNALLTANYPCSNASDGVKGCSKLSAAPLSSTNPIAVGDNDPRLAPTIACGGTDDTALLAAAESAGKPLTLRTGQTCATNSQTLSLTLFMQGGLLKPLTGQTLTINGALIAGSYQVFTNALAGQGTVDFTSNKVTQTYQAAWWGARADGATLSSAAWNALLQAAPRGSFIPVPVGITLASNLSAVRPVQIFAAGNGSVLRFPTGTSTSTPMLSVTPPATSGESYSTNADQWRYVFTGFVIDAQTPTQGGDGIKFNIAASGHKAYLSQVSGMLIYPIGGKDVEVANDNGSGSPNDLNGTIHLEITDNIFSNGIKVKYGSDSLKIEHNIFANTSTGGSKIAADLTFISGAGNVSVRDNTFTLGAVVFHNGTNVSVENNYFELTAGVTLSHGAALDLDGDVAQIKGGTVTKNIFFLDSGGNGIRLNNAKGVQADGRGYAYILPGSFFGVITSSAGVNGISNPLALDGGGSGWSISSANTFLTGPFTTVFSSLPNVLDGSWLYCADCNSLCTGGGGTGRSCVRENGAWTH